MNRIVKKEMELAGRTLSLETGRLAFQANQAVLARYGETVILATVVANKPQGEFDYFPLRVDFEEKLYAGGFIKTSRFIKRETKPTDEATVAARLIDHAVRPLFPKDFMDEVQVIVTALSVEPEGDPELVALIAASAALSASDIPWHGPLGTVRIAYKDGVFLLNPPLPASSKESENGVFDMDVVISYLKDRVVAIEGEAKIVPEEKLLEALEFGQKEVTPLLEFLQDFAQEAGRGKYAYDPDVLAPELAADVKKFAGEEVKKMLATPLDKLDYVDFQNKLKESAYAEFEGKYAKVKLDEALAGLEKETVRHLIMEEGKRPDGRKLEELRSISTEIGILPRTHGSALFVRGLTQALTIVTLGSSSLEQLIQTMTGEETKRYMHHYSAPPYSTGETAPLRSPGRREIGHGMLAEKALRPVVPAKEQFPYAIRVVSEILSQNGSTSMASTCGSSLALMDAGVPITAPVAGVAVGLITDKEESRYVVLTDIAGVEDFDGFMDFKMAGTRTGLTAVQMDIKLHQGLPLPILREAVRRSREARLKILDLMEKTIDKPRAALSQHAPKITLVKIDPKRIGEIIGPGGRIIKKIIEETGAAVDVDDDGMVYISAKDETASGKAKAWIEGIVKEIKVSEIYEGKVTRLLDFGAFVEILPGKEGLVHISELSYQHVPRVEDFVKIGDQFKVKVISIDEQGRINLSKKALDPRPEGLPEYTADSRRPFRSGLRTPRGGAGYRSSYYPKPGYRGRLSGGGEGYRPSRTGSRR